VLSVDEDGPKQAKKADALQNGIAYLDLAICQKQVHSQAIDTSDFIALLQSVTNVPRLSAALDNVNGICSVASYFQVRVGELHRHNNYAGGHALDLFNINLNAVLNRTLAPCCMPAVAAQRTYFHAYARIRRVTQHLPIVAVFEGFAFEN
jgi:uncharacterized protein with PIN domain